MVLANLVLRFGLELAALVALGYAGFNAEVGPFWRVALGIGGPLAAAALWGVLVAPRSSRRLPYPRRLVPEVIVFGAAVLALLVVSQITVGFVLAGLIGVHLVLNHLFR